MSESKVPVVRPIKKLFRHIIEYAFCYHDYEEIYKVETKNSVGSIVKIEAVRECTLCGRSKRVVI